MAKVNVSDTIEWFCHTEKGKCRKGKVLKINANSVIVSVKGFDENKTVVAHKRYKVVKEAAKKK